MARHWATTIAVVLVSAMGAGVAASAFASTSTASGVVKRTLRPRRMTPPLVIARPAVDSHDDPAGDSGNTADITRVEIGNDVVAGPIVEWVTFGNRTSFGGDDEVLTFIDSDLNAGTGLQGVDYVIDSASGDRCVLAHWDGSNFVQVPAASLRCRFVTSEKAVRIEIQPADLGGTRGMNLYLVTFMGGTRGDDAPDGTGVYTYSLISGPVKLSVDGFAFAPSRPRHGGVIAAVMQVSRDDINEVLSSGTITCTLKAGTRSVRGAGRFTDNGAACAWRLPGWTKGKRVRGTMAVAFGGTTVSRNFAAKVR
jgi:hypothetical protein